MENLSHQNQKNNLIANLFLFNTIFMLFSKEFNGIIEIDLSFNSFNFLLINEDIRSNVFYVINNLMICLFFYGQKSYFMRLSFVIAIEKLVYKLGMLIGFYEYNKGFSDFLNIGVLISFLIFNKIKWKLV